MFLGTWKLPLGRDTTEIVSDAFAAGYRNIDCAYSYGNDFFVGKAIKKSKLNRDDLFITNKLWKGFTEREQILEACKKSLKIMKLDYFDLYLVHWPVPNTDPDWQEKNCIVWSGMESLCRGGLVKSIGVSNFLPHHIEAVLSECSIIPSVNQIEYHPGCLQTSVIDYCDEHNIGIQGWSPLGSGKLLSNTLLTEIALKHNKTPAQICLRWSIQNGIVPILRSKNIVRLKENLDVYDFALSCEEMSDISKNVPEENSGYHPDLFQPV